MLIHLATNCIESIHIVFIDIAMCLCLSLFIVRWMLIHTVTNCIESIHIVFVGIVIYYLCVWVLDGC